MTTAVAPPPSLNEAVQFSKEAWQRDLQSLFDHAKERFADVVWELVGEDDSANDISEEVWGHKAIVYARAPPSFQARYFSFRPAPAPSPMPAYYSPNAQSALSLNGEVMSYSPVRSPSPYDTVRTQSPAPSTTLGQVLRLTTTIASALFSNELEYLYTGKGFGEAFEFLFDSQNQRPEGDAEDQRIDKLRKDLVFMWRSRLYSDVRLSITGKFASSSVPEDETQSAQFSSHRFMLASRSPYFRSQLLGGFAPVNSEPGQPLSLNLPSPPFTPASLHFILGYIYTGTLAFSNRSFDLDTAFHILRCALYLSLASLYNEVQARIVQEMLHGLFHAFLDFSEYENVTGGKWGVGGCKCKTCARRAPRVLEFATADDVKNIYLERGARRAIVGHYGEGWCTQEFAALPIKTRESVIKGVSKRAIPMNILSLLIAAHQGLAKLDRMQAGGEAWWDISRGAIVAAHKHVCEALCAQPVQFFEQPEWIEIMESDGSRFEDIERVEWVMDAVQKGLSDKNGGILYQTLVNSILIRPHPTESGDTMLSAQSRIRALVERTREEVVRYLRRKWMAARQEGAFNNLESWALKEISHEIEVPVEELRNNAPSQPNGTIKASMRVGTRLTPRHLDDDASSISSSHSSIAHRHPSRVTPLTRERVGSSANSVRSVSTTSTTSTVSRTPVTRGAPKPPTNISTTRASATPSPSRAAVPPAKPSAPSIRSQRSPSVSTLTKARNTVPKQTETTTTPPKTTSPAAGLSRSATSATAKSEASSAFQTARSDISASLSVPRPRRSSGASSTSVRSSTSASPRVTRSRKNSDASVKSAASAVTKARKVAAKTPTKPETVVPPRPRSSASVRSVRSVASVKTTKARQTDTPPPPVPAKDPKLFNTSPTKSGSTTASPVKGKEKAVEPQILRNRQSFVPSESDGGSTITSGGGSTIRGSTFTRKASNDTITALTTAVAGRQALAPKSTATSPLHPIPPKGAVLNIGIPCIVTSKRTRFRAFARYIGEVEGEVGPWVGLEVPVSDSWGGDKLDGRQWNDGSWGGIRYFDIHQGSEWDEGEERAARRRRLDNIHSLIQSPDSKGTKREGEQLAVERSKRMRSASPVASDMSVSDTRGLFVRPQQVLYVVDAVGSDI